MSISSINKSVGTFVSYSSRKFPFISKALEKKVKEPAKFAATMMVISLVSKDLVGCYYYTEQSLHNKKIPEEKRRFVAGLDLMNGIINVCGQLVAFNLVDRLLTPKLFSNNFTGVFKDNSGAKAVSRYVKTDSPLSADNIVKLTKDVIGGDKELSSKIKGDDILSIGEDVAKKLGHGGTKSKDLETGFTIIVTSLATTAFIKRCISPLFATPLAEKFSKKGKKEKETKLTPAETDSVYFQNKDQEKTKTAKA